VKKIGFLSFGHWSSSPGSRTRSASEALLQSIDLAEAAEELGADGAYFRVHHFARQLGSPFPLLAAIGARTSRIEIGTAVIDMRYENESDKPFHLQQAEQIQAFRDAWREAGHQREPRVSVSRSIFALVDDRDRAYFGRQDQDTDQIGFIDARTQAIFGRTYAAEPDVLIAQLKEDEAIAAADTLLLTVPSQLGVDYNAHAIDAILTHVAPALGWR
jgi:alkanesulfonate monooxygenase SsuD/methylene tetrahydromethanopterin reductase-like flavin-dependent oxidoreductase (luciferase family)